MQQELAGFRPARGSLDAVSFHFGLLGPTRRFMRTGRYMTAMRLSQTDQGPADSTHHHDQSLGPNKSIAL